MEVKIGMFGGSGLYDPEMFSNTEHFNIATPYGSTSDRVMVGELEGVKVAFIPRHGKGHVIPPHKVNFRANIWAMKKLGVERIISPCTVGSLKDEYKPGELVVVDQFIDFTKRRDYTFYDGSKVAHLPIAEPFCPELREFVFGKTKELGIAAHPEGTYVCIEGPRFSTKAESRMFRSFADIVGMTLVPECQLAREKDICYVSLAMVTDYDVWKEHEVNIEAVLKVMGENIENLKKLVRAVVPVIPEARDACECKNTSAQAEF
ncbi:MAG: S-methyl-5'-thioadenosine phosphorylase [Thermoplasmata archaeon]|nr:MAG: S-methyl-5'-thioadenosine phosphorylase [Thermoplasmata archaeon]